MLTETTGWVFQGTSQQPTQAEFEAILANATKLRIRGEYRIGADTGSLDNAIIIGPNSSGEVAFNSPDGDFSVLTPNLDDTYSRRLTNCTVIEFDEDGLQTAVTDPAGRIVSFERDQDGNLVRMIDADGTSQQYTYDTYNRMLSESDKRNCLKDS